MHSFIARQLHVILPLILVQPKMKLAYYIADFTTKTGKELSANATLYDSKKDIIFDSGQKPRTGNV